MTKKGGGKVRETMAQAEEIEGFDPSAVPGHDQVDDENSDPPESDDDVPDYDEDEFEQVPQGFDEAAWQASEDCAGYDQNDRDNGRRLIRWFGANLLYISGLGWLTWRGTHWQRDEGDLMARLLAQDVVDKIKLEPFHLKATPAQQRVLDSAAKTYKIDPDDRTDAQKETLARAAKIRKDLSAMRSKRKNWAVTSGNAGRTTAMLLQASSHMASDQDDLDRDKMLFNVRNCTLVLERVRDPEQEEASDAVPRFIGRVTHKDHDRRDFMTKLADVDYDPDATCPQFQQFLDDMQPDQDMQTFLKVFHGYAMLIGGNGAQVLAFHYGLGANGKSAFIEATGRLAGTYRTVVSPDTLTGDNQRQGQQASPDIARLFNTRYVTVEELPKGVALKEDLIKAVSGGSKMTARFLQKEIFEFVPIFTAVLTGNTKPQISGSDEGIWRRVLLVHWSRTVPVKERVPFDELMARFDAERSGILNWLIDGAELYLGKGLWPFVPASVTAFTEEYRKDRDNIGAFCEAMIVPAEGATIQAGTLYTRYTEWCEVNAMTAAKQRTFGDRLTELGYKKKVGRTYTYLDIECLSSPKFDPVPAAPTAPAGDPGWEPIR